MAEDPQHVPDSVRLQELEERLAELSGRIDGLVTQVELLTSRVEAGAIHDQTSERAGAVIEEAISPGMINVISLIQQGESDHAQQELYSLPEDELSAQPGAVALVAAALFVQRGDYSSGLKALQQVRQLTNDPRLLALMTRLEEQATQ